MLRLLQRATTRALVILAVLLPGAALAQFGVPAPVTPAIPCPAFTGFPLALNLGTISANGTDGIINRCAFQTTQAALNALSAQATGNSSAIALLAPLASPTFTGIATMPKVVVTGSGSTGDVSAMSIYPGVSSLMRTLQGRAGDEIHLEDYCIGLSNAGTDVTSCMQSAVNAAALTGRCLTLPPTPSAATYWTLSGTITIGNGSTTQASTTPGVCIQGAGSGGLFGQRGTYFRWGGASGGTMFQINGPIENVKLRGFNANGANVAGRIINAGSMRFSEYRDIFASACTQVCIGTYGIASNGALNFMLDWSNLYVTTSQSNAIAVDFDGVLANNTDTWLSTVRNSRFESFGANGRALRLAYSDNILFSQLHAIVKTNGVIPSGGCAVLFDATTSGTGGNSFPTGHLFVKSAIDNTCTGEDASHTIGVSNFIDFGTTDSEVIPTSPKLRGITDQGYSFNGYGGPSFSTYAPTVAATTPGSPAATFNVTTARYAVSGKLVTVNLNIAQTATGTGAGTAVSVSMPTTPATSDNGTCFGREDGATGKSLQGLITAGTSAALIRFYDGTYPLPTSGATLGKLILTCTYEAQ